MRRIMLVVTVALVMAAMMLAMAMPAMAIALQHCPPGTHIAPRQGTCVLNANPL